MDTSLGLLIGAGGAATLAAFLALAITQATLGSPLFFVLAAVPTVLIAARLHLLRAHAFEFAREIMLDRAVARSAETRQLAKGSL